MSTRACDAPCGRSCRAKAPCDEANATESTQNQIAADKLLLAAGLQAALELSLVDSWVSSTSVEMSPGRSKRHGGTDFEQCKAPSSEDLDSSVAGFCIFSSLEV